MYLSVNKLRERCSKPVPRGILARARRVDGGDADVGKAA